MIKIQNLSTELGGHRVLQDINFSIEPNDFWLIFGPNGAGKTTLLRILAGQLSEYSGHVQLGQEDIRDLSTRELARRVAYLPQEEKILLPLRVMDILLAGRYPYRSVFQSYSPRDHALVQEAIEFFELHPFLNRDILTLSGGERKKVLLASAFVQDVSIFLLDEPLNFLDPAAALSVIRMLKHLRDKNKAIVVVSHSLEHLFPHVNKMLAIREGKLIYAGDRTFSVSVFQETYQVSYRHLSHDGHDVLYLHE